ncbi:hypothetical protein AeMF1_001997 [Aphanomyces euteiches]|nr:hypothetical protein AeMF1_001997 [Aphanomyces euteiches]KAH9181188.1 hypothetical protein AeNC1_016836 [Aphanomyces euteiches]
MSGRKAQSKVEAKRRSETLRKRKYRAAKRHEVNQLTLETHCLEQTLAALNAEFASEDKATTNAMEENTTLRKEVNRRQKLVRILSDWFNLHQRPQKALANSSSWTETTLLAHSGARKQGIQWLSERVYHHARLVLPGNHPYRGRIDDALFLDFHRCETEDGPGIAAVETHYQYTACTDFLHASRLQWDKTLQANAAVSKELIERVGDRFMYYHHINSRTSVHLLTISAFFKEDDRVVITYCFLAKDEVFPLRGNIFRPHGFAWTVYEAMTDDVTLISHSAIQFATTADGEITPMELLGSLYGKSAQGVEHREAYIEQVRSSAYSNFVSTYSTVIRDATAELEQPAS